MLMMLLVSLQDLVLMMLDASKGDVQRALLERELEAVGLRLNKQPPAISYSIKKAGGIQMNSTCALTHLDERLVRGILHDYSTISSSSTHCQFAYSATHA